MSPSVRCAGSRCFLSACLRRINACDTEMHQYLDSDGSGTSPTCVSPTIGAERLQDATQWLQQNNLKGFLGEIGAGSNGASPYLHTFVAGLC